MPARDVASLRQHALEAHAERGALDLPRVRGADRRHRVGEHQSGLEERRAAVELDAFDAERLAGQGRAVGVRSPSNTPWNARLWIVISVRARGPARSARARAQGRSASRCNAGRRGASRSGWPPSQAAPRVRDSIAKRFALSSKSRPSASWYGPPSRSNSAGQSISIAGTPVGSLASSERCLGKARRSAAARRSRRADRLAPAASGTRA